jgi:hypothetical protein
MSRYLAAAGLTLFAILVIAPSAQGGAGEAHTAAPGANKALCKHACLNAARACAAKRTVCAAQKQRCLRGCK